MPTIIAKSSHASFTRVGPSVARTQLVVGWAFSGLGPKAQKGKKMAPTLVGMTLGEAEETRVFE